MSLIVRIPLSVDRMSALAGYFTDGPSMISLYGLVSELEQRAKFAATGFGLVVESYESTLRSGEFVTTGFDAVDRDRQKSCSRSMLGFRHATLVGALYLKTEDLDELDTADLLACIELAINACRVQGGNIVEFVGANEPGRWGIKSCLTQDAQGLVGFISKQEKPISKVYLANHLPEALQGDALLDAYARELESKDKLLVCNGYRQVGKTQDQFGELQRIGDGVFTLVQSVPVHQLPSIAGGANSVHSRFFWSFDKDAYTSNPNHFIVS